MDLPRPRPQPDREAYHAADAAILVRDWGLAGAGRHADSHAPAHLEITQAGDLTIAVTRGEVVVQRWTRVGS